MNVSNQRLRRRLSSNTLNKPIRRVPGFRKRSRSSNSLPSAAAAAHPSNSNDGGAPTTNGNAPPPAAPLAGVTACLSGQTEDAKIRIHAAIAALGGTTMGRFDPRAVTHLILDAPAGSKYDSWRAHRGASWANNIAVVTSAWALACEGEGRRVPEEEYALSEEGGDPGEGAGAVGKGGSKSTAAPKTAHEEKGELPPQIQRGSLVEKCSWMIERQPPNTYRNLFDGQSFILVGFDEENDANGAAADQEAPPEAEGSRLPASIKRGGEDAPVGIRERECDTLKGKVSALIRRAGGEIFWEPNEWISVVLLSDNPSKRTWEDARHFCREHPRGPICVGVDWILKCIYQKAIADVPPFPPEPQPQLSKRKVRGSGASVSSNMTGSIASNIPSNKRAKKGASSVFRGDVFAVVHVKALDGTLDFATDEMESNIAKNGGLLLSKSLLLAIKKDVASATAENANNGRRYFVVSSRWVQLDCATSYPLIGGLSALGIQLVPVSPVWVAACLANNYKYDPEEYPVLFQPQMWPIRLLEPSPTKGKPRFSISVTGFVDASRYGIKAMLKEIGAEFTENLTRKNTHLICKERKGQKYAKAVEWGVHAVSVEWLYHVIRYGADGKSEDRFSLSADAEPKTAAMNGSAKPTEHPKAATSLENGDIIRNKSEECNEGVDGENAKDQCKAETSPPSESSVRRRGNLEPPQSSPQKRNLPQASPTGDTGKRLQFASPIENGSHNSAGRPSSRRRGKRDRTPLRMSQESTSLLSQQSDESASPEAETQFTVGTICANADVHSSLTSTKKQFTDDDSEAPLSQVNDAHDNGESQVLWFAAPRG